MKNEHKMNILLFWSVCSGIIMLQIIYTMDIRDFKTQKLNHEVMDNSHVFRHFMQNVSVDFTVNDMLDNMKHGQSLDYVKSAFSDVLKYTLRNTTTQGINKRKLKIIVVPHSHNDPGYKKTFLEYFNETTRIILSLIVEKLSKYDDMTFIWPETCFIEKWWKNQSTKVRDTFKHLVKSGRLEITSGAWVIPDEATPHYFAYLDQMIEGHSWVKRHLGVVPETSFDMDQFSLTSTVRHFMREAGIKYGVVKRIHLGMKKFLMKHKLMNFFWKGLPYDLSKNDFFVHLEPYEWLSFSDSCGPSRSVCEDLDLGQKMIPHRSTTVDEPIRLLFHNYSSLCAFADEVVKQLKLKSAGYIHDVILLPHGADFRYRTSFDWETQYKNMKTLMQFINSNEKYNVHMKFGTLKDYFMEVKMRSDFNRLKYHTVAGDFVPYATRSAYWSGFFTTRQFLKRLGRELQENVRAADILTALVVLSGIFSETSLKNASSLLHEIVSARRELNLFQHHDAITGTSDIMVVKDYEKRLLSALSSTEKVIGLLAEIILYGKCVVCKHPNVADVVTSFAVETVIQICSELSVSSISDGAKHCREINESYLHQTKDANVQMILYNPFTQARTEIMTLSSIKPEIIIFDQNGLSISFDILWERKHAKVFFKARLPPLSLSIYKISKSQHMMSGRAMSVSTFDAGQKRNLICENNELNITFSTYNASPMYMCYKSDNFCIRLNIYWRHYIHSGGAYTMAIQNESKDVLGNDFKIRKISGNTLCVVEVSHKLFKVEYILRNITGVNGRLLQLNVYTDLSMTNSENFAGEFAMRIVTSIQNRDTFYTDSNGFYLARRRFRENLSLAANVYPMTSMAVMKDCFRVFTLHSAQPHGVLGWQQGILDIMIDRVALKQEQGLKQQVKDNKITLSKLFMQFEESICSENQNKLDIMIPSSRSLTINDILQHPVINLVTMSAFQSSKNTFDFVQTTMPTDMIIANMKCMTNDEFKIVGISMTVHRRQVMNCDTPANQCEVQLKEVRLSPAQLFENVSSNAWKVKEMTLTHLNTKKLLSATDSVSFESMDVKTCLFYK